MNAFDEADALLRVLDEAPVGGSDALFRDFTAKEWMETAILRASAKLKAAEYHRANIQRHIDRLHQLAIEAAKSIEDSSRETFGTMASATMLSRGEQNEIAFEFDAFLAAGRACIDFIANMLALHFKGMNRRTGITSLLKNADDNSLSPFAKSLETHRHWIEQAKTYRDECIHYRTIRLTGGYKVVSNEKNIVGAVIPVVIPDQVLPDVPDTRRRRGSVVVADILEIGGIPSVLGPSASGTDELGATSELALEFRPGAGYVRIEEFCGRYLEHLHEFASQFFEEVASLKFHRYVG